MRRKQIYIEDQVDRDLKRLARASGTSEAVHVRAALCAYLDQHLPRSSDDPLARLVGLVAEQPGPDDVAAHHDRHLYGAR